MSTSGKRGAGGSKKGGGEGGAPGKDDFAPKTDGKSSSASISPYNHKGGEASKKLAKEIFDKKRAETPEDWKDGFAKDDRWVSCLPEDWSPAVKMTDGGILHKCFVGPPPDRQHFFHKPDLEKHLGRELRTEDERGKKPTAWGDIDPKKYIRRLDQGAVQEYINNRCNSLHGLSVEEALTKHFEHSKGEEKAYTLADLKYDIKYERLELVDERPSQSSRPSPVPGTPARRCPGTPRAAGAPGMPSTPRAAAALAVPGTPRAPGAPGVPSTPRAAAALAVPGTPVTPPPSKKRKAAPSTPSSMAQAAPSTPPPAIAKHRRVSQCSATGASSSTDPAPRSQRSVAADVFRAAWESLKTKAASSDADEKSIFAMLGVGYSFGIESDALGMLPTLLRKPPSERGQKSMQFLLQAFEEALSS